ncbi:MAG: hypothetical protein IJA40_05595 [Phascolarctobacterium sp.]|nr:hypothetical protein [Phascolarctobacterium sp.]
MRKISFANYITSIVISGVLGGMLATGVLYLVAPAVIQATKMPNMNYGNILLGGNGIIAGSSPFGLPKLPPAPVSPVVPDMPQGPANVLEVVGVLPPDVVVLQRGGESVTAYLGDETKFGVVQEVRDNGAVIDGRYVALRLKADYVDEGGYDEKDDE